jgi:hypothetical protein
MLCAGLVGALSSPAVGAGTSPRLPGWVKPGIVLQYAENLAGYVAYDYTDTVTSVSQGTVKVTTYTWSPGLPGTGKYLYWSCPAVCSGEPAQTSAQFWVDPSDPVGSLSGGHWPYRYEGVVNFAYQGKTWRAGELYDASAHGPIVTYFLASTGLFLYHKEYGYSLLHHSWYTIQLYYRGTERPSSTPPAPPIATQNPEAGQETPAT